MLRSVISLILLLCLCTGPILQAQFTLRGSISGAVTDPSGALVPDSEVVLLDVDRNQRTEAKTTGAGLYTFANLPTGHYQVAVQRTGFGRSTSSVVELGANQQLRVDMSLQVGAVSDAVQVHAEAPMLDTEQTSVGQVVNQKMVESLPILGRNFTGLASIAPDVTTTPLNNQGKTFNVGAHQVYGGEKYTAGGGGNNGFYYNGVNINENYQGREAYSPSLEAVSEVKLDVSTFSAENSRDATTLMLITRGGSNAFHGSVYDTLQNSALNAWNPLTKSTVAPGTRKPFLQRNDIGGNFGGPVVIPKLIDGHDKLFFFANYQHTIDSRGGSTVVTRVPTEAERQGDFSGLLQQFPGKSDYVLYDPFSTTFDAKGNSIRNPIPNNDLRSVRRPDGSPLIDKRAQEMLALFPLPNGYRDPSNPNSLNNYQTFQAVKTDAYRLDTRIDYSITSKDNVYFTFARSHSLDDNAGGIFPPIPQNSEDSSTVVQGNYVHMFSPTITNEFNVGYGRAKFLFYDQATLDYMARTDTLRNKYFKNLGGSQDSGIYALTLSGYTTFGPTEVFGNAAPRYQISDNVSWNRGKHSFKFGLNWLKKEETDFDYIRTVNFDNTFTRAGSSNGSLGGDAVASFLIGIPSRIQQRYGLAPGDDITAFVVPFWGAYAQDTWRLNPRLTINYGLAYSRILPSYSDNMNADAVVDFSYPGWQLQIPGRSPNVPLHYLSAPNDFAPRLGIAYRLRSDMVLRAGYGIYYDGGGGRLGNTGSVPSASGSVLTNSAVKVPDDQPYFNFDSVFPAPISVALGTYPVSTGKGSGYFDFPASVTYRDQGSMVDPYFQKYTAQVQKGIGSNATISVEYSGMRGVHIQNLENLNLPAYKTGYPSTSAYNAARPNNNGRFTDVLVVRHGLNLFHNAGIFQVERRFSKGVQFISHYTWSKTVQDYATVNGGTVYSNRSLMRGEAPISHPHRVFFAGLWELPGASNIPSFLKPVINGWKVNAIVNMESGDALTIANGRTSARDFEPNFVNVSGDPNLSHSDRTATRYFNTSVFSAPPQDVKGNAGVGIVRGPGQNNWNISTGKQFRFTERLRLDFRSEFLNAFNHTQIDRLNTTFDGKPDSTFGRANRMREPRIIQMYMRLQF